MSSDEIAALIADNLPLPSSFINLLHDGQKKTNCVIFILVMPFRQNQTLQGQAINVRVVFVLT